MKKLILICAIVLVAGCASLQKYEKPVKSWTDTAQVIADVTSPATGGFGTIITSAIGLFVTGAFAVNKSLLAKKRGDAIKEINANPDTPPAMDQVVKSKESVLQVVGKDIASGLGKVILS